MATKPKSLSDVRPHDVQVPPAPKPIPPGASQHRSLPQGAEQTAQKLVHETGSVRKAKTTIDAVADMEGASNFREDQLAIRWGFRSRKEMLAASKPIEHGTGHKSWATELPDGCWVVWNQDSAESTKHPTFDAARQSLVAHQSDAEPKSPPAIPDVFIG